MSNERNRASPARGSRRRRAPAKTRKPVQAERLQQPVTPGEPLAQRYVDHSLNLLLDKFGAGGATPGSGSATAIEGALASQLVQTVAQLTLRQPNYADVHPRAEQIRVAVLQVCDRLKAAIDSDSEAFDRVMNIRAARDAEQNAQARDQLIAQELFAMRDATLLPLQIAADCTTVAEFGIELAEKGFRSADGESMTAMALAIAAGRGAIMVAGRNLRDMRRAVAKLGRGETDFIWLRKQFAVAADLLARLSNLEQSATNHYMRNWSRVASEVAAPEPQPTNA